MYHRSSGANLFGCTLSGRNEMFPALSLIVNVFSFVLFDDLRFVADLLQECEESDSELVFFEFMQFSLIISSSLSDKTISSDPPSPIPSSESDEEDSSSMKNPVLLSCLDASSQTYSAASSSLRKSSSAGWFSSHSETLRRL